MWASKLSKLDLYEKDTFYVGQDSHQPKVQEKISKKLVQQKLPGALCIILARSNFIIAPCGWTKLHPLRWTIFQIYVWACA